MEDKVSRISGSTGVEVREGSQFLKHSFGLVEQGACLQLAVTSRFDGFKRISE